MKRGFILLCLNTLLCACTPSMPLVKSSPTIDIANGMGVGIFTMEIRNDYKNYAPQPISLTVKNTDTRSNVDTQSFSFGDPEKELGERGYEMTASVALPAGEYYITELAGVARSFPIAGRFYFNPNKRFILKSGELTYLGHLVVRLVERTSNDEERAGPILPVVDQSLTGMSDGTFKIDIHDSFDTDMPILKTRFPALVSKNVGKELLR